VFAWGLQYKLSLYDPPQATSHLIPQAKLLSKNEQSATMTSPLVIRTKTTTQICYTAPTAVFIVLLVLFNALSLQPASQWSERASDSRRLHCGLFNLFFVRPPPFLI
jgi:hypothetical protein